MDIKQDLADLADLYEEHPDIVRICGAVITEIQRLEVEIKRLEASPRHRQCVHPRLGGYPHESGCVGCRIEKTCTQCGHFVDLSSQHR